MKDYILKEINKIGQMIESILVKIKLLKVRQNESVYEFSKIELLDKLSLNIDSLLEQDNIVEILIKEHEFNSENLDKFAELLYDITIATNIEAERLKLAKSISAIYEHLDKNDRYFSFNRFYILKGLEEYT